VLMVVFKKIAVILFSHARYSLLFFVCACSSLLPCLLVTVAEWLGFDLGQWEGILYSTASRPALGSTQSPILDFLPPC
jgi:hypothetical protein